MRPTGISKGVAVERIVRDLAERQPSQRLAVGFALCVGHFLGRDEDVFSYLQEYVDESAKITAGDAVDLKSAWWRDTRRARRRSSNKSGRHGSTTVPTALPVAAGLLQRSISGAPMWPSRADSCPLDSMQPTTSTGQRVSESASDDASLDGMVTVHRNTSVGALAEAMAALGTQRVSDAAGTSSAAAEAEGGGVTHATGEAAWVASRAADFHHPPFRESIGSDGEVVVPASRVYTCTIGRKRSQAMYFLNDSDEVAALLEEMCYALGGAELAVPLIPKELNRQGSAFSTSASSYCDLRGLGEGGLRRTTIDTDSGETSVRGGDVFPGLPAWGGNSARQNASPGFKRMSISTNEQR